MEYYNLTPGENASALAFDYGSSTVRFGIGLEDGEASQILEHITSNFPQFIHKTVTDNKT